MVDVIGRAKVIITGDVDSKSIDQAGGKIGSKLKVGAAVGVAALGTLAVAGVKAFKSFEDAESVSNKLANTLKNMGKSGATEDLEKLASTLQRQTGISDETIKSGQTLLATFDSVAASAGEAGGTFDRATRAAVDMSSVFGSVESASRTLGKALSDPEKAAALLKRSNVILTEEQKKLITAFNDAGDAAGAQDVILSALEDRYKGTAEAGATESQKISEAMGEIEEAAGEALAALLGDGEGGSLSNELFKVSDAISEVANSEDWETFGKDLRTMSGDLGKGAAALVRVQNAGDSLKGKWKGWGTAINAFLDPIGALRDAAEKLIDTLNGVDPGPLNQGRSLRGDDFFGGNGTDQHPFESAAGGRIGSGLRRVGENGPEVIEMGSGGGYVHNNSETRAILTGSSGATVTNNFILNGPNSLSEARRSADWETKYGTRFGAATNAGGL